MNKENVLKKVPGARNEITSNQRRKNGAMTIMWEWFNGN